MKVNQRNIHYHSLVLYLTTGKRWICDDEEIIEIGDLIDSLYAQV